MCTRDDPGPAMDYVRRLCVRAGRLRKTEGQKCGGSMSRDSNASLEAVRPTLPDRGA
jgi:hypothetical protein